MIHTVFSHKHRLVRILSGLVLLATLGLGQLLNAYAGGVLYVAPTGNDANSCLTMSNACGTIVAAVSKASSGDTIIIATGTYTETITIDKELTLIGFGADATIINQGRIVVSSATVRIYDLAITNGYDDSGGALLNTMGVVTLGYTSILSSHANSGGGIYNYQGTLVLDHSIVADNSVVQYGGGIFNNVGSVSISHSTIMSNTACNVNCLYLTSRALTVTKPLTGFNSYGGGISNEFGSMTIDASAIVSNSAATFADGINNGGILVITNSTISGNGSYGLWSSPALTLTNVTLSNHILQGLRVFGPGASLRNTIIANTTSGSNCTGSGIVSLGHNLSSDSSCTLNASGDLTNTNPLLGPLQDNGGPTPTHALLSGSPAINHADNIGCPAADQRGIARPQAGVCDIGAYESVFPYSTFLPVVGR
jgi:hypothetical protein